VHFTFDANTGSDETVGIFVETNPNVNGVPLDSGDEIGAFAPDGLCVGGVVWQRKNTALAVHGYDSDFKIPGIHPGEIIGYRFWKQSDGLEYQAVPVYSRGSPVYEHNGICILSSLTASEPLPVELSKFEVSLVLGRTVEIVWRTESETNCYAFRIERRLEGAVEWTPVAMIPGQGTKPTGTDYSYIDTAPADGTFYYRIVQVDSDGTEAAYSAPPVTVAAVPMPMPTPQDKKRVPYWVVGFGIALLIAIAYILFS
jgi:hypothetical protein